MGAGSGGGAAAGAGCGAFEKLGGAGVVVVVVDVDVVLVDGVDVVVLVDDGDDASASAVTLALRGEASPALNRTAEPDTTAIAPTSPVPTRSRRTLTEPIATPAVPLWTAGASTQPRASLSQSPVS